MYHIIKANGRPAYFTTYNGALKCALKEKQSRVVIYRAYTTVEETPCGHKETFIQHAREECVTTGKEHVIDIEGVREVHAKGAVSLVLAKKLLIDAKGNVEVAINKARKYGRCAATEQGDK